MTNRKNKLANIFYLIIIILVLTYLFVPLLATLLYSLATDWTTTVLPEGFTLSWYLELFSDPDFYNAMLRTLLLATLGTLGGVILIVPTVFLLYVYHPKYMWIIDALVIFSFSVPGVIAAMSLMSAYSGLGVPMIIFVVGSYIVGGIPMIQLGTRNGLRAIDAKSLMESAEILGADKFTAFRKIILPNIQDSIVASALFRFSSLFGEFGTLNLLVGGAFPNIQIFLRQNMTRSGHYTAAITISYFVIVTILTVVGLYLTNRTTKKMVGGEN